MNPVNDDEKSKETREARSRPTAADPDQADAASPAEAPEFRELTEGGYGWGV